MQQERRISHKLDSPRETQGKFLVAAIKSVGGDSILADIESNSKGGLGLGEGTALYLRTKNLIAQNPTRDRSKKPA